MTSEERRRRYQTMIEAHQNECAQFGYTFGTVEFGNCMMELDRREAALTARITAQHEARNAVQRRERDRQNKTIRCTSSQGLGTIETTCNESGY